MALIYAAAGALAVVVVLVVLLTTARGPASGDDLPLFATDDRCPVCAHRVGDHARVRALSDVFRGCNVAGCACGAPITRVPVPR